MKQFDDDWLYRATDPALAIIATPGTLAQWRHHGIGPPYVKFAHRVLYRGVDLNRWVNDHLVTTERTEPGRTAPNPPA